MLFMPFSKMFRNLSSTLFLIGTLAFLTLGTGVEAATVTVGDKTASTNEDTVKTVTLTATGSRGETFTYQIVSPPTQGTATLSGSKVTYTPAANYNGTDSFLYKAYGSVNLSWSTSAKVTITINAVNDAPVMKTVAVQNTTENVAIGFATGATDIDGDTLSYKGIISGGSISVDSTTGYTTVTPVTGFVGNLTAYVRAYDGRSYSDYVTITINVADTNFAPTANEPAVITVTEDTAKTINLSATDPDGDVLQYALATAPTHGTVSWSASQATYTPSTNYNGSDSFEFVVSDGKLASNVARVTLTVTAVNDPPVAVDATVDGEKNRRLHITLGASDVDSSTLTYSVSLQAEHGEIENVGGNAFDFDPDEDYVGSDQITFYVNDGQISDAGIVTVNILAPTAVNQAGVGTVGWQYDLGNVIVAGVPALVNGVSYFGSAYGGTELYAFTADGLLLDSLDIGMNVESGIMAVGNRLVVNTLVSANATNRGTMQVALNADGTFVDTIACVNQSNFFGRDGLPARNESGDTIYTVDVQYPGATGTSYLTAFNTADCTTRQAIALPFPGWGFAAPLFYPNAHDAGGTVIIGIEVQDAVGNLTGQLLAYTAYADGTLDVNPIWTVDADSRFDRGATAITTLSMIFAGTDDGDLYGIDVATGTVAWQIDIRGGGYGSLSVGADNRTLYALNNDTLFALDAVTGNTHWTVAITNRSAVALVGDAAIYVLGSAKLVALNVNGTELWNFPLTGTPVYGYLNINPVNGQLVFAAGSQIYSVVTESTQLSPTSDFPNIRADVLNSGLPALHSQSADPTFDPSLLGTQQSDIEYCNIDGVSLKMDMHYPTQGSGPFKTLIYVHGGGWVGGDKDSWSNYIDTLNARGYLVAAVNYRLAPTYKFPAPIQDLKCAVRHLRANNVSYNLDRNQIGMFGGSAGAYLVALMGTANSDYPDTVGQYVNESSALQAVIVMWGVTDLTYYSNGFNEYVARNVFGYTLEENPEFFYDASPVKQVTPDDPAMMVIQGMDDGVIPADMSVAFADTLEAAGVPVTRLFIDHANHGLVPTDGYVLTPSLSEVMTYMADFFDQQLQ